MSLPKPILLIGAGALGSSILKGFRVSGHATPDEVMILDLMPGDEAKAWAADGARLNPLPEEWSAARTVILAVKPQGWHAVAQILNGNIDPGAVYVSVMAGVTTAQLKTAFAGHAVARVMPTTGVATGKGVASLFSDTEQGMAAARGLFAPMAQTVELNDESQMNSATAVSGSGPAYVYAFVSALEKAGKAMGLSSSHARDLARGTLISAARLLDQTGEEPEILLARVASPGGTTEAALKVLRREGAGLDELILAAVEAAHARSKELG
ncbi:pyrroline-5-carboxylate reductase [Asticcacaulis sp. EMRT-3]|uniref:pyrroline-5-carboxylate reductase n=1 Tax=Asticcacaulis sp. EMRT-3 TaxID=3040349 RepID=UPI0024AED655|nr:pyrroline-5-carboxylate reductase [Asticcacaulis sp. EMRT-3]MDI7774870.1 pyrroline-5-carboxylate reductase [Asticcacaulis sp. EMRT-3]